MQLRIRGLAAASLLWLGPVSCDKVSFTYVDEDRPPPPRVTVVERHPPREVHVVHTQPVEEVHVVHSSPVREVHVVETPGTVVHVHEGHCCTPACNHYYSGGRYVVVGKGHRHGPGCGHHYDGRRWVVEVHKGKVKSAPPPQKYRRD